MAVSHTILHNRTEPEKILGIVEATLTDLLPKPNIEQRLAEIHETLKKNADESIIMLCISGNNHCTEKQCEIFADDADDYYVTCYDFSVKCVLMLMLKYPSYDSTNLVLWYMFQQNAERKTQ